MTGILADVTPAPGRSIVSTQLLADSVAVGAPDLVAPYGFGYTVPASAVTDSTILLQVQAADDQGGIGVSLPVKLFVKNDVPVASMTAVISGDLQVTVDASGCSDTETAEALEVRFDWENDGT